MTQSCPECDHLSGRLKDLCYGTALIDGKLATLQLTNKFRAQYGLPPLGTVIIDFDALPKMMQPDVNLTRPHPTITPATTVVTRRQPRFEGGVGTELKSLLSWFSEYPGCGCGSRAAQMDLNGIQWCQDNIDTIVGWLVESAKEMGIPTWLPIGWTSRHLVDTAINNAKKKSRRLIRRRTNPVMPFSYDGSIPRFLGTDDLMRDTHILASRLAPDTPFVIGIARSGLAVATMVSMLLHLPLKIFRQQPYGDVIDAGNGWRLSGNVGGVKGRAVVIDDTVMTGNSFKYSMPIIRRQFPNALSAAVYCNPTASVKPDIWAVDLPWPHLLAWNLPNSILTPSTAYDFDGIICHDCDSHDDDDGSRYESFLRNVKPLYVTRKNSIPLIVTASLEKYRTIRMQWLHTHGIRCEQMIMGPWRNNRERAQACIGTFKGERYKEFLARDHRIKPAVFLESDVNQARVIAIVSGGLVACPAGKQCFLGDRHGPT